MDETIQKELAALKTQMEALTKKNEALEAAETHRLKGQYERFLDDILEVVSEGDVLELNFDQLVRDMESHQLFVDLTQMNNPTSEILGFEFGKVIIELAKKHFLRDLPDGDQERFKEHLKDAVKPPFLKILLQSNPFTQIVSNVVSKVISFVKGVKIKGHNVVSIERAFAKEKLKNFIIEIEAYLTFYAHLVAAAEDYNANRRVLKSNQLGLESSLDDYHKHFLEILEIKAKKGAKLWKEVYGKFNPEKLKTRADLLAILDNPNYKKAHKIAVKFPALAARLHNFKIEYYRILMEFFQKNLLALEDTQNLSFKKSNIEALQNRIKDRIADLDKEIQASKAVIADRSNKTE